MSHIKDYPTEEQLRRIETWEDISDFHGFMNYIYELWESFGLFGWEQNGEIYSLHTGGWSGNEEIISAMEKNMMFWVTYWAESKRGGHYKFYKLTFENMSRE